MEGTSVLEKLKKKLTNSNVRNALNEGKFKEFVDDIRKFKKDEKIDGALIEIVAGQKTGDLPSLAKKFDVIIPTSGVINVPEIERTLSALRSIKKLSKGLKEDIAFPRYVDIYPPSEESKGKLRGMGKPTETKEKVVARSAPPEVKAGKVTKVSTPREMKSELKPKEMKPSQTTGKTKAFTDKEVKDMMEELGVTEKEAIEELKIAKQMKPEPLPPPVMSPDERDQAKAEQKAEEKAEEKPQQNVKMEMEKPEAPPSKKPDPTEIDKLEPLPSKSDFIPPMRLGTRGKDINELLSDINYFFKNFKSQLKRESEIFKEVNKSDIEQLRKLHDRIVGKLAPKPKKEEGKKVGIIVNADEYIREQMKKILQEQTFSSLRPQDVIIDVGSREAEGRDRDTKDFGDFAVKRTIDGGLASQREAIFRYMPSENDPDVGEEGLSRKQKAKPKRLNLPPPRLNNERTNAIRRNVNNPFRVPQRKSRISFLY